MLLNAKKIFFYGLTPNNEDLITYKTQLIANPCFWIFSHKSYTCEKILVLFVLGCLLYLFCSVWHTNTCSLKCTKHFSSMDGKN